LRQAERLEFPLVQAVPSEHDLIAVSPELGHMLRHLFEPRADGLRVEPGRWKLDHSVAARLELIEQRLEPGVGDDRDTAGAGIGAQRRIISRRCSSSSGS
jgi:hypothetical protein